MVKDENAFSGWVCPFGDKHRRRTITLVIGCAGSLGRSSALFSSYVTNALDVCSSSGKILSAGAKKGKKPRNAMGSKNVWKLLKVRRALTIISMSTHFKRRYSG